MISGWTLSWTRAISDPGSSPFPCPGCTLLPTDPTAGPIFKDADLNLSCRFTLHFVNALPSVWNCHSALLSKQIQTLRANINVFSVLIWHLWMSTLCHCSSTKVNWEIKRKIIQFGLLRGYGLWWWGGVWTNNYQGLQRREYGAQKAWNIGVESWRGAKEVRGQLVRWEAQSCVPSHIM